MEVDLGKLFIGGISWDTDEDRLRQYFQTFGEVIEAVIMKDRNTGRARGFGFVVFADPTVAEKVVLDKHIIDGRAVEAKKAVPREDKNSLNRKSPSLQGSPGPVRTKKIFVGGLASTVTESEFKKYFDQFGIITDVVVMYDHNTQRPRGFGFITYDSEEAVETVLLKTFHELNGKIVEVKRAVPKQLSAGPMRGQLSGYNNGISRVTSFLNGYTQGFNQNLIGGYGARTDGRFSPVQAGRNRYPPLGPSGYGMGLSFDIGLSPTYGASSNFNSKLGYGRVSSPSLNESSNRYASPIGFGVGSGGITSLINSPTRSLWGNDGLGYSTSSSDSSTLLGSGNGHSGFSSFGNKGTIWSSSPSSGQVSENASAYSGDSNINFGTEDFNISAIRGAYGRNKGTSVAPFPPFAASDGPVSGSLGDLYGGGSLFRNNSWLSTELEASSPFGYGLRGADSDITTRDSAGNIDAYSVTNRQSIAGIAA